MKQALAPLLLVVSGLAFAGTPIAVTEVPENVSRVVADYFPESRILAAEQDTHHGRIKYELQVQYKDIHLEVDVGSDGRILDVDMD